MHLLLFFSELKWCSLTDFKHTSRDDCIKLWTVFRLQIPATMELYDALAI